MERNRKNVLISRARKVLPCFVQCLALAVIGLPWGVEAQAAADDASFLAQVQADTEWLASYGTRQIGTAPHARLQADLQSRLQAIPGVQVWSHEFPVVVPVHEETVFHADGGVLPGPHAILPLWPDVARLNTTPAAGIQGSLVYVGDAAYDQLPAQRLKGSIAVMEMRAQERYHRVFDLGAVAVIFLESNTPGEPVSTRQSVYKPRYYVADAALAAALRENRIPSARITSRAQWKTVTARNLYAGVRPEGIPGVTPYALVAPYDAMSRVMDLAPGADAALDCAVLLNVLREEAAAPSRPLLFGFLDAYHINQLGMRQMGAVMSIIPGEKTRYAYGELEQKDLADYRLAADELIPFKDADAGLVGLRSTTDAKYLRRFFKDAIGPDILRLSTLQGNVRLASLRGEKENTPVTRSTIIAALADASQWLLEHHVDEFTDAQRAEIEGIQAFAESERQRPAEAGQSEVDGPWSKFDEAKAKAVQLLAYIVTPLRMRNRVLGAVLSAETSMAEEDLPVARSVWNRMAERVQGQLAEQQQRVAYFDTTDQLRQAIATGLGMPDASASHVLCSLVVGLDLSDCGIQVGPGGKCPYNMIEAVSRDIDRPLKRAVQRGELWPVGDPQRAAVNMDSIEGRSGGRGYVGRRALITSAVASFDLSHLTWITDDAPRFLADSPLDRAERLDWKRIGPQLPATRRFLSWILTARDLNLPVKTQQNLGGKWRHGMGRIVDVSSGETVPRVPRRGFLVTLVNTQTRMDTDGIRCHEFALTGHDGSFRLPILCAEMDGWLKGYNMAAFKLATDGAIVESLSTTESMVSVRLATSFSLNSRPGEQLPRAVTFPCRELNGPAFFDARFMEPLKEGQLLDTVRGGAPKQAHFSVERNGQMWGLVNRDIRWQLIVRAGATRVRMALLNALKDGRERGLTERETFLRGYAIDDVLPSIPAHVAVRDLATLNDWRLADYRSAGIKSDKIDTIRTVAQAALKSADEAVVNDDGAALQRQSVVALSNEIRAYQAVKEMGLDVARGAIFLMLMLVPFCVAMERLLFASARIGRQIMASLSIFTVMTLLLWSFHPAFRISAQPLVIVMAFTILSMSIVVIGMVLSRFKASVREFQSSMAEGSAAKMSRGGLIASAVFLGIANMRKRKVRTLLTGTTVVLVTFALLCFSSTSSYVDRKDFRIDGGTVAEPSVLVRRTSFDPLPWTSVDVLKNLINEHAPACGARVWLNGGMGEITWKLNVINPRSGKQVALNGGLGLPPNEDKLSGVDSVLPNWPDFAKGGGCYLAADTATLLGVAPGETVVVRGQELVLRGVYDPLRLEDVTQLDGQRLLPYDYSKLEQDWLDRTSQNVMEQESGSSSAMQPGGNEASRYISANDLMVLENEVARRLGGSLRSFGIACETVDQAAELADRLAQTIAFPAYYTNRDGGVNVLVSTPLIAMPPKNIAIPLIIAAMIIFTTILNSVSERRGEIYVYTSLGLAPTHVGALFLAEALTYGLMGAVFGYIAGQGTATLLTGLGMMEGITLNYSGTAVIKTMLLVQFVARSPLRPPRWTGACRNRSMGKSAICSPLRSVPRRHPV